MGNWKSYILLSTVLSTCSITTGNLADECMKIMTLNCTPGLHVNNCEKLRAELLVVKASAVGNTKQCDFT